MKQLPVYLRHGCRPALVRCKVPIQMKRFNSTPGSRVFEHIPFTDSDDATLRDHGIPGLYTAAGYKCAWTDCQQHWIDQLNRKLSSAPPLTSTGSESLLRELIKIYSRNQSHAALFNYASMTYNNMFFFRGLKHDGREAANTIPQRLRQILEKEFYSISNLKEEFLASASAMFSGGFVWLVLVRDYTMRIREPAKIAILRTYGAGSPLSEAHFRRQPLEVSNVPLHGHAKAIAESIKSATLDVTPLLCVSTWEHSYLTDYRVDGKDKFLDAWWEAINWDLVNIKAIDVFNMPEQDKKLATDMSARLSDSAARPLSERYKSGSY